MRYLLDTDHFSVFQRQTGDAYQNLRIRMMRCSPTDFVLSVVTVHEQFRGVHAYLNNAKRLEDLVLGYALLSDALKDYMFFRVLDFDDRAVQTLAALQQQKKQLSTMDARIASIALSRDLTLLTRNQRDFVKVPELKLEDWTIAL
jgi:tRNA(fMet)-specific endonuclease VapC